MSPLIKGLHSHDQRPKLHSIFTRHPKGFAPELHIWKEITRLNRYARCASCGDTLERRKRAILNTDTGEYFHPTCILADEAAVENARGEIQQQSLASTVEYEELRQEVSALRERIASLDSHREVTVKLPDTKPVKVGRQHQSFEVLVKLVAAGLNVALKGPAGSGKTTAGRYLARALKTDFYVQPLGPQTSKSDLLGYMNGQGNYVRSMLRDAFEHGGVILLDEMDAANPAVLTIINGMLANGVAGFPDGMVERHKSTRFLAAMNTFGRGADALYVGRAQLDAATLDRWVVHEWDYDWAFTRELAQNDEWSEHVQRISDAAIEQRLRVVIGPRAALHGARMLAAGFSWEETEQKCVWAPISPDDRAKIRRPREDRGEAASA